MRVDSLFAVGIAALLLVAVTVPSAGAHNTSKYTNIPFVVAGACPSVGPASSAKIVSVNGIASLQVVTDDAANGGGEVYCSSPSTGTLPSTTTGTFPEGVLSFNFSTPASGVTWGSYAFYSDFPTTDVDITPVVNGNTVSISATNPTTPGAGVVSLLFYPYAATGTTAKVTMNNFLYNRSKLLFDTTITDESAAGINFCEYAMAP